MYGVIISIVNVKSTRRNRKDRNRTGTVPDIVRDGDQLIQHQAIFPGHGWCWHYQSPVDRYLPLLRSTSSTPYIRVRILPDIRYSGFLLRRAKQPTNGQQDFPSRAHAHRPSSALTGRWDQLMILSFFSLLRRYPSWFFSLPSPSHSL